MDLIWQAFTGDMKWVILAIAALVFIALVMVKGEAELDDLTRD